MLYTENKITKVNILLFWSLLNLLFFSTISIASNCNIENKNHNWALIKKDCEADIKALILEKDINMIGKKYFQFSELALLKKKYLLAENILYNLMKDYATYLQNKENHFHWFYHMGKINIRHSLFKEAVLNFQEALLIAESLDGSSTDEIELKNKLTSYSLNGLGLSFSKIMQYQKALSAYRRSLVYKKKLNNNIGIAKTLSNIATVYDYLEDSDNALLYYIEARDYYLISGQSDSIQKSLSHSYENIGIAYNKLNKFKMAISAFNSALQTYPEHLYNDNQVNIYTYIANSHLNLKQDQIANKYYQLADTEDEKSNDHNIFLKYEMASYYFNKNDLGKALDFAKQGISLSPENTINILPKLYEIQSKIYQQQNDFKRAWESMLVYNSLREKFLEKKFDQDIRNISYQIELDKNHYNVKLLQKGNLLKATQIKKQYWIILSITLLMFISWLSVKNIFNRKSKEKELLIKTISEHKQKIIKMEGTKNQLKEIFTETSDAILCIDSGWVIAFYNKKFNSLFNTSKISIDNKKLKSALPDFHTMIHQLPADENDMLQSISITDIPDSIRQAFPKANVRINTITLLDDYTVFSIGQNKTSSYINNKISNKKQNTISLIINSLQKHNQLDDNILKIVESELNKNIYSEVLYKNTDKAYRATLVELMVECVEVWNKYTKTNRFELAESSGYWKITIDDGRLRTRAMDRYLIVKNLPKNPRWRLVVKTAHFVLSECEMNLNSRNQLNTKLDSFLAINNSYQM